MQTRSSPQLPPCIVQTPSPAAPASSYRITRHVAEIPGHSRAYNTSGFGRVGAYTAVCQVNGWSYRGGFARFSPRLSKWMARWGKWLRASSSTYSRSEAMVDILSYELFGTSYFEWNISLVFCACDVEIQRIPTDRITGKSNFLSSALFFCSHIVERSYCETWRMFENNSYCWKHQFDHEI